MNHKVLTSIATLAALSVAGVAGAAELGVKVPAYKAPPPVVPSYWAGFYVGGHGGYGWGNTSIDPPALPAPLPAWGATLGDLDAYPSGAVYGGHVGYNWQFRSFVTGVEADFSGASVKDSGTVGTFTVPCAACNPAGVLARAVKFDELASARARLGYAVLPHLLVFGTGGLGWGHSTLTGSGTDMFGSVTVSGNASKFGWVAGGGLEYVLCDHVMLRAEYLHYEFGSTTYAVPLVGSVDTSSSVTVARGGVSYKF